MKVLHIDSSILGEGSASRALTREIVARVRSAHPEADVTHLDLAAEELPHLSQKSLARSDEAEAARNTATLEQFLGADLLVIGVPIYNFSIPSHSGSSASRTCASCAPRASRSRPSIGKRA
jgi:FMN-dependent NADH-azoreductase